MAAITAGPYTSVTMPIHVSTTEKKAEIARDVVVAYLSHVKDEELSDLGKVDEAITRLVDVVDRTFEVVRAPGARLRHRADRLASGRTPGTRPERSR